MRALDKENVPTRKLRSSYGILRHEPWNPRKLKEHRQQEAPREPDELDGEYYLEDTID